MNEALPFLPPALALFIIVRRGMKPQRIKPDRLWIFPGIITILALTTIWRGQVPGFGELAIYIAAALVGGVMGWFTTRHIELTLDEKTGTVMSQPTFFATATTAAVFLARFALDYFSGAHSGGAMKAMAVQHGASLALITNAGLLFVAARGLSRAWHMVIRIHPLLEQHKASQLPPGT